MSLPVTSAVTLNKEMAREYLAALDSDATSFTFQIISDAGTGHTEIFHSSLDGFQCAWGALVRAVADEERAA
jgi:hypothetical protein